MIDRFFGLLSHDVGIDLGTANTMVLVRNKGIAIREPSVVARQKKSKVILAIDKGLEFFILQGHKNSF